MPNWCFTTYKIAGVNGKKNSGYRQLKHYFDNLEDKWLGSFAKHFGIDYESLRIHIRGWVEYYDADDGVITIGVESAWSPNEELLLEINKKLGNKLSISWRAEEPGCEIFWIHDEWNYFPERYYVDCSGFDNYECDYFETLEEVVNYWCKLVDFDRTGISDEEMRVIIDEYEYGDDDKFFYIHEFDVD